MKQYLRCFFLSFFPLWFLDISDQIFFPKIYLYQLLGAALIFTMLDVNLFREGAVKYKNSLIETLQ